MSKTYEEVGSLLCNLDDRDRLVCDFNYYDPESGGVATEEDFEIGGLKVDEGAMYGNLEMLTGINNNVWVNNTGKDYDIRVPVEGNCSFGMSGPGGIFQCRPL